MEGISMQIIELNSPINHGSLYSGLATSRSERRYTFCATRAGNACAVILEDNHPADPDG
jgi:hypothetical protein